MLAFGESLAFLSLFIPAWALLVAIGALINASGLVFWPIWLAAAAGAAAGDWVSYWFGFHFKDRIAHMWPLSRHPDMLPRGHAFMEKWGVLGIFIGRFFGPLRAVGAADRRHPGNGLLEIPDRQCGVGDGVGLCAARVRRFRHGHREVVRSDLMVQLTGRREDDARKPSAIRSERSNARLRNLYDKAMRGFGRVPYVARAQGARFVVDTTDLIDRELAINAIWEAEQLEDFAAICRTHNGRSISRYRRQCRCLFGACWR